MLLKTTVSIRPRLVSDRAHDTMIVEGCAVSPYPTSYFTTFLSVLTTRPVVPSSRRMMPRTT